MFSSSFVLVALLHQLVLGQRPPEAACEDPYVELARAPAGRVREVCISPGLVTAFVSDVPITSVDLEGEVLFEEVTRGRRMLGVMPPSNVQPGERRRLTLTLGGGSEPQQVSFTLVVHPGLATRQIEVFRDLRSPESLRREVEQERARNQRLHQENERLLTRIQRIRGLSVLLSTDSMWWGLPSLKELVLKTDSQSESGLSLARGQAYRTAKSIAVRIWLRNDGAESWNAVGVSLVDAHGADRTGLQWSLEKTLVPRGVAFVVVEADAQDSEVLGPLSLKLWDAGGRSITIPQLVFP